MGLSLKKLQTWFRVTANAWEHARTMRAQQPHCRCDKRHELAVCAIFKDEAAYLREWVEFHHLVGVDKFYLYNNNSTDNFAEVLQPYVASGLVDICDWRLHPGQMPSYNHCLQTHRNCARWMTFIDIDEFLFPAKEDRLTDVLPDFQEYPGVAVSWVMYASSGHILKPDGLVIENFVKCQHEGNKHIKLIVDPQRTREILSAHHASYRDGALTVNELKRPVEGMFSTPPSITRLRINHYWTKSVEEFFLSKVARGETNNNPYLRGVEGCLVAERLYNTGEDYLIQRYLPRLRARLAGGADAPARETVSAGDKGYA